MSSRRSVYQRIIQANIRHTGLRLTPDDVRGLAADQAIIDLARNDDDDGFDSDQTDAHAARATPS